MSDFKIKLYRRERRGGVDGIFPVGPSGTGGGGWDGQRNMRGVEDNVTLIYSLGLSVNDQEVFEVKMKGAKSFITDGEGLGDLDFERVNLYTRTLQPEGTAFAGSVKWQSYQFVRVYSPNVATCVSLQVNGVDENGDDQEQECFKVTMVDGDQFVTDRDGWNRITSWF
jgi:hypothetical protein